VFELVDQAVDFVLERLPYPEIPPRVEYRLTPFGKKFLRLLKEVEKLQAELNDEIKPQPIPKRLEPERQRL
jgi:DNA-binding HxlR family transcriptional regulator